MVNMTFDLYNKGPKQFLLYYGHLSELKTVCNKRQWF